MEEIKKLTDEEIDALVPAHGEYVGIHIGGITSVLSDLEWATERVRAIYDELTNLDGRADLYKDYKEAYDAIQIVLDDITLETFNYLRNKD